MKKTILVIMFIATLLLVFNINMASANGGPHGGFTATTDACAGCHRTHTATNTNLLIVATPLCLTCHGAGGTGADTDVQTGIYDGLQGIPDGISVVGNPLMGGRFVGGTSNHDITATVNLAWGNGVARGTTAAIVAPLECSSCHDPHGTLGYRLLRTGPTAAGQDYDSASKNYNGEVWGDTALSTHCATCHSSYHVTQADAGIVAQAAKVAGSYGNDTVTWAHRVNMAWNSKPASVGTNNPETAGYDGVAGNGDEVPLAGTAVVCTTCHFPHGTAATMIGQAADAESGPAGNAGSSALLRLNNRGVCQSCHQK